MNSPSLCVVLPCLNEELAIGAVVADYRKNFPDARILVIDNASTDQTGFRAKEAGADVIFVARRGKASAIVAAFSAVEEDIVIMADGDGSYPAGAAVLLRDQYLASPSDMITGIRTTEERAAHRPLHQTGTRIFGYFLKSAFGHEVADLFSGLRLFSKRFYKNVPILARGYELEMELTIQCIDKGFTHREIITPFAKRAEGTSSKLRTAHDGFYILRVLISMMRDYRPFQFFGWIAVFTVLLGFLAGSLPIYEFITTGFVGRLPLAVLAASLVNLGAMIFLIGILLEASLRHHRES